MITPLERFVTARSDVEALPGVVGAALIQDDPRLDRHALEVTVGPEFERVPPSVLRVLARHDLGLHDVSTRGDPTHHVVVAI